MDETRRARHLAAELRGGRAPTLLTDARLAQGAGGGTESQEARLTGGLATRLRGGRAPTILTGARLAPGAEGGTTPSEEAPLMQGLAARLRGGRAPTILTGSRVAPGADGGTGSSEEARLMQSPLTRLRGGRAPTILTGDRLAGSEPTSYASRSAATAGAPREAQSVPPRRKTAQQRIRETQRRMIEGIGKQIRPEAQREIDTFKRNPSPKQPHIFRFKESRRSAILNNWPNVRFNIDDNPEELGEAPWYRDEDIGKEAVKQYDEIIEREARAQGVKPRLVRAIMYVENADGNPANLNRQLEKVGLAESILPMNIKPRLWVGLIGVTEEEFRKPEVNIRAAVTLIKRIEERLADKDRTPAKIGSIYNFTGREKVSDVGARIQKAFDKEPWDE